MAEEQPSRGERPRMTPETFTQQWAQIRQHLRGWWDQLTEHDLEQIAGQQDQLVRVTQERYHYLREHAQDEVDWRLQAYQTTGSPMAEAMITAAEEAASRLTEAGEGRATATGTALLDRYAGDFMSLVRRHPVASVLVGVGMGVLLASSLRRPRQS